MRTGVDDSFVFGEDLIEMFVLIEHVFDYVKIKYYQTRELERAYELYGNQN